MRFPAGDGTDADGAIGAPGRHQRARRVEGEHGRVRMRRQRHGLEVREAEAEEHGLAIPRVRGLQSQDMAAAEQEGSARLRRHDTALAAAEVN